MATDLDILIIGAMLHDIGKFCQRAERPYSKEMEGEILPSYKGRPSHWHALYTDYFIENDLPLPEDLEPKRSQIARVAAAHHRPDNDKILEMCIGIADRLSSGADRFKSEEPVESRGYKTARLISAFDEIELFRHRFNPDDTAYYALKPLDAKGSNIFPEKGAPVGEASEYKALFENFLQDLKSLNTKSGISFYSESLVALLEKYTWAIPSASYQTLSDVSLFDHSFSTATIAQALFKYHETVGGVPKWEDKQEKFTILAGDLSGIQDYIFGISKNTGRGVAKIFRARSFYLQAIVRSIILAIQRKLEVYSVCRLVDSGGKFLLLLPNTETESNALLEIDKSAQKYFQDKFKARLTLSLSWQSTLSQQDFEMGRFQMKLDETEDLLAAAKNQKLRHAIAADGPVINSDYDEYEAGNCSICGINASDAEAIAWYMKDEKFPEDSPQIPVCKACYDQISYIGRKLPNTNYLVYGEEGQIRLFEDIMLSMKATEPSNLDSMLHVEGLSAQIQYAKARIARHIPQITDIELKDNKWFDLFEKEAEGEFSEIVSRKEGERPKSFNMIALKSKKMIKNAGEKLLIGRPLLGFMKADVDNLGLIFSLGFGNKLSVARLASASRMLELFFSEYLVHFIQEKYPDIYVVFAGGDDLFLVGPWWQCLEFSLAIRKEFSRFCADNQDITLSAGILAAKPRLPMRKAVQLAEAHLEKAKTKTKNGKVKNAVTFLNTPLDWIELQRLSELGQKFDAAIEDKERSNFSMGFLYRLLNYHKMYKRFHYDNDMKAGRFLSLAHYDIGRNIRHKEKERANENKEEMDQLFELFSVGVSDRQSLEHLHIPLFYAMNRNRRF